MTCQQFIDAATAAPTTANAERAQLSAMGRAMDGQALQHGPALTTVQPQTTGTDERIERRAARMRHANQIRRARYIRLHQILSKREGRA